MKPFLPARGILNHFLHSDQKKIIYSPKNSYASTYFSLRSFFVSRVNPLSFIISVLLGRKERTLNKLSFFVSAIIFCLFAYRLIQIKTFSQPLICKILPFTVTLRPFLPKGLDAKKIISHHRYFSSQYLNSHSIFILLIFNPATLSYTLFFTDFFLLPDTIRSRTT